MQTYLERDIPQLGVGIPATILRRFWQMLAHWQGQLWNASTIAKSLGITSPTVKRYLDLLEDTFMLRQLVPFFTNAKKRLVKTPKVYLRDSGLLHALVRIQDFDDLIGHPAVGALWEVGDRADPGHRAGNLGKILLPNCRRRGDLSPPWSPVESVP